MGNCFGSGITPSESLRTPPTVRLYGPSEGVLSCYLRFALSFKPVKVDFVVTESTHRSDSPPVIQFRSDTISGSVETMLRYIDSRFPEPRLLMRWSDEMVLPVVTAAELHHRSMMWHVERLVKWAEDLVARGGRASGDPVKGSPRMEVKKFGRSYSQLLEVMLEHAQMEERVIFPILERADRGLCRVANEEHARDLPIMNGIREDIKSIGVMDLGTLDYEEALFSVSARLKILRDNCKEHFEEEERDLLPLLEGAEMSRDQHRKVLEECFDTMQSTHSHLFLFFIEGLLPHEALHYLDLVIGSSNGQRTASILRMIVE